MSILLSDLQAAVDAGEDAIACAAPAAALGRPRHSLRIDADGMVVCSQCRLYASVAQRLALYRADLAVFEDVAIRSFDARRAPS